MLVFVISLLLSGGYELVRAQEIPSGSYLGSYYTGKNFDNLVFTKYNDAVNFNWGISGPDPKIGRSNFSVRWQGKFNFDSWLYEFTAISDDGIRVYFDGERIIDAWHDQAYWTYRIRKEISAGQHTILVEYYQNQGGSAVKLNWVKVMPVVSVAPGNLQGPTGFYQGPGASDLYSSSCVELSSQPSEGTIPLTVQFTGAGYDPYGAISEYKFDFADTSDGQPRTIAQEDYSATHTYGNPGTYNVTLQIQDSKGIWRTGDSCKEVITLSGSGVGGVGDSDITPTLAATPNSLPKTGMSDNLFLPSLSLLGFGSLGLYLFKRFKQI